MIFDWFLFFSFPVYKFPRFHAELFLETFGEIRRIIESYHITDFIDAIFVFCQQDRCFFQTYHLNQFIRGDIGQCLYFGKQARTADTQFFGQEIYG